MIAIVGAGITGLTLAHELARRGRDFVILEAAQEPGGVMRSFVVQGHLLEPGPQRTRLTSQFGALVDELGLRDELITAPPGLPLYVFRDGKLRKVPFSLRDAFATNLISWPGKARVLLEPLMRGSKGDESVADFLVRKFGREAYANMLGPLYGGLYASDPKDMLMRHTLSRALAEFGIEGSILMALARRSSKRGGAVPACSFRGGMRVLTDALYTVHRDHVRLGTPILGIERRGSGYALETRSGAIDCEELVLTTPADVSAGLLREVAPEAADRLERLNYNPLAVTHLLADCPIQGMGFQVAFGERLETRGVTFNASMFGRTGVYTVYLGGAKNPGFAKLPDVRIGAVAAAEFEAVTGCAAEVLNVGRVRMPAWDRSWDALVGLTLPPRIHLAANYESRAGVPGRLARARQLADQLAGSPK